MFTIQTGSGRGVLIPHSRSFFTRIPHPALFSSLSRISAKRLISAKLINLRCRLALSIDILCSPGWFAFAAITFSWVVTISRIPDRHATKSHIPCPNFGESRFPGSSQIPNPVEIFFVFPNPAPYFGQIPDPENTLPDPVQKGDQTSLIQQCSTMLNQDAELVCPPHSTSYKIVVFNNVQWCRIPFATYLRAGHIVSLATESES